MTAARNRMMGLDIARIIAAFLVILEHMLQFFPRFGMNFFHEDFSRECIYVLKSIHISVFITIAGILIGLSRRQIDGIDSYLQFEHKKFLRLMLPYFSISVLQLLVKVFVPGRGCTEVPSAILGTFVSPHSGGMPHGWYLMTLMTIFLLWPLLKPLADGRAWWTLLAGLITLAVLPIPWPEFQGAIVSWPYFELNRTTWYLPIFAVAYWYGRYMFEHKEPGLRVVVTGAAVFFIALLGYRFTSWPGGFSWCSLARMVKWLACLSSGFCVVWMCRFCCRKPGKIKRWLSTAGLYSYDVYLLHVIVGHALVLALSRLHPGGVMIYTLVGVMGILTLIVSMGIGQIIRRSDFLAFVILGEPRKKTHNGSSSS